MADVHCPACRWTAQRQVSCRYESHVKLFYGVSDRGAWSLGFKYILKERSDTPPNFEGRNLEFLKEKTIIPVPTIVEEWTEKNSRHFLLSRRISGEPLSIAWATMTQMEKERVAQQTADYLSQLRRLQSPFMQSLDGQPIYSAFLFPVGYGIPHGPLGLDDDIWEEIAMALGDILEIAKRRLRARMPPCAPYTFTHGDLANVNILIENGNLMGIMDWEASGYFPAWWEFTGAGISLGPDDLEWKAMLRKYMPDYTGAREFSRDEGLDLIDPEDEVVVGNGGFEGDGHRADLWESVHRRIDCAQEADLRFRRASSRMVAFGQLLAWALTAFSWEKES